ncbi:MAG TPA: transketolase C-terminal domain-containing protein [Acidimicrobiales bacterium]
MSETTVNRTMSNVFDEEAAENAPGGNVVGAYLAHLAKRRDDVVALSADLGGALAELREARPDRYIEMGIAETNSVSVAAGLAASGFIPYIVSMGPFSALKTGEQYRTDLAATNLPVRMIARLTGVSMGFFGTSHHAVEDIAITRSITNLTVVASSDNNSLIALLESTVDYPGPVYFRVSEGITAKIHPQIPTIERGRFVMVRDGSDLTIIATGVGTDAAFRAAEVLETEGVSVRLLDATYLKPLDEAAIVDAANQTGAILTVEEHNVVGGLGTAVAEVIARNGIATKLSIFGLPDEHLEVSLPNVLYEHYGLTGPGVAEQARKLLAG